jgi:hypothetical protein
MKRHYFRTLILPMAALAVAACSDSTGNNGDNTGTASLRVLLTDAPSVEFDSAIVWIGAVTLIPVEGAPIVINDEGGRFDLLDLQNGVTAELGNVDIEPGDYSELRLVVTEAYVGLAEPFEFEDGTTERSLKIPSGAQSGIKVKLGTGDGDGEEGVTITPGETILVVDFDVSQNFKIQGNPNTPAGLKGVLFTPVLRAVVSNIAGSIAGTVTSSADGSPIVGATVRASIEVDGETIEVTAVTGADGTYVISFLAPGTYEVSVDAFSAAAQTVEVGEGEDVTDVDFSGTST